MVLRPILAEFQNSRTPEKQASRWHKLCVSSPAYERWRKQQIFPAGAFDLAFSGSAARAYSGLFERKIGLPPCYTTSQVLEISRLAHNLLERLPSPPFLPGPAQEPAFRQALRDLEDWQPKSLLACKTARGDPMRRWLIVKIAEELCFAFAEAPTIGVVGDLIRLGWPRVTDRSIRNTLTPDVLRAAEDAAETRRENENNAIAATHQSMARASSRATRDPKTALQCMDVAVLAEVQRLLSTLKDNFVREGLLASVKATRAKMGYPQEIGNESTHRDV